MDKVFFYLLKEIGFVCFSIFCMFCFAVIYTVIQKIFLFLKRKIECLENHII